MHYTKVTMKDGRTFDAPLHLFRPWENPGYLTLMGVDERLYIRDMESAVTENCRIRHSLTDPCDELARARRYMQDARKYNWHGDLPVQEWETLPSQ